MCHTDIPKKTKIIETLLTPVYIVYGGKVVFSVYCLSIGGGGGVYSCSLVPGPFRRGFVPGPITSPVQSPVPGPAWGGYHLVLSKVLSQVLPGGGGVFPTQDRRVPLTRHESECCYAAGDKQSSRRTFLHCYCNPRYNSVQSPYWFCFLFVCFVPNYFSALTFFFKIFCLDQGPFLEPLIAPVLDFVCPSSWVSNPEWISCLHSFLLACCDPEGHIWCDTCLFHQ